MVLDTRWKRFKYSNGNKTLCVVLALVMAAVIALNGLSIFKALDVFGDDVFKNHAGYYNDSPYFVHSLNLDIDMIFSYVGLSVAQKEYYKAEEKYVEKGLQAYKAEEEKNRLDPAEVQKYIERLHNDESIYDDYYGGYYDDYDDRFYLSAYYNIYYGDDHNWYKTDFDYESLTTANIYLSQNLDFGHSDAKAEEMLRDWFYRENYGTYVPINENSFNYSNLNELKNLKFYAESDIIFTNVTENVQDFISEVKRGNPATSPYADYLYCENGELHLSGIFKENEDSLWAYTYQANSNVYISVNRDFTETDKYRLISDEYEKISTYNVMAGLTVSFFAFIALVAFAVMSVRLAGHTEDGIRASKLDRFPMDLHFILNSALILAAGCGLYYIFSELLYTISNFLYSNWYYSSYKEIYFSIEGLIHVAIAALAGVIYLLILEFATSIARNIKAEQPIIKRTAIYRLCTLIFKLIKKIFELIFKLIKLIFKHGGKGLITVLKFIFVTVIGGFFKLIWKLFRNFLHMFKLIAFIPKRLERKLINATVLYTLFNFASIIIIAVLLVNDANFFAFWGTIALVALDAYTVYRAMKYLKALDDIIDSSAKREPLPYETDTLPPSLKTLAESLEATNAELQEAVLKAVKDERTKAELITNVSHDLKTPLTSVINYIDLLQKCDIEDETAKQYMAVIDEKSARLKRLIEDLIEASKVSTGNITLNKTKLNLCELASQAIVEETSDIEKNNLQIIFDETAGKHIVYADGTKIYRVFENLLSNARKYSAPYSRIYARVYSDDNAGYFEIKNISKDPLNISAEELTERFVRGDKSRSEEGNGLGLSIARELCKLNGGDLIITIDGDLFKATVKLPKEENQENTKE